MLRVSAPDVTIRGCVICGSGNDHEGIDSGVRLLKGGDSARVMANRLIGNLYGVDIHGARDALVRGNGVYVWNAPGARVVGHDIRWGRDGIFVNTSHSNAFIGNRTQVKYVGIKWVDWSTGDADGVGDYCCDFAGKSTLIKLVLGLTRPTSAAIAVAGHAPGSMAARTATAYLPEQVAFHKSLTGREQLTTFARLAGGPV